MKFQNCIFINFITDARTDGQAKSNMPLQLFQSWGHKKMLRYVYAVKNEWPWMNGQS